VFFQRIKSDRRLRALAFVGNNISRYNKSDVIWWIEKLLSVGGIEDGHKDLLFWVLAPYLVSVRKLDHDRAYTILESWLDKCAQIRSLDPDWNSFRHRMRYCLDVAESQQRKPIRFQTFREYYPDVYRACYGDGGG
jgi:hypothetical protein